MTNPFALMEEHKERFTQNDLRIYEGIRAKPDQVSYQPTGKLAESFGVSQPALTRFIKTLGYARFQDFRSDMTAWLARQNVARDPNRLVYFERLELLLKEAEQVFAADMLLDLARYLASFKRTFATGIGKSLQPAELMQALFRKHGIFVGVCHLDMLHEVADHLEEDDLLVVFSVSAQAEIMDKVAHTHAKILLITTNAQHRYVSVVDRTVVVPYIGPDPESCPVSPVLFDVLIELLDTYGYLAVEE